MKSSQSFAARSVELFAYYIYLVGIVLVFAPNQLLRVLQLPETQEIWIRVLGVVVFALAAYYHRAGAKNEMIFVRFTVPIRIFVFVAFTLLVVLAGGPPVLILFGSADLLGALFTMWALRRP
jgi:hypothetical protein